MATKKYKRMTNREKDERKRFKKNLQEKGIIPPDKPRLNRKKFGTTSRKRTHKIDKF